MKQDKNMCCMGMRDRKSGGILSGILYGLIPHSFCIAFIFFSIIGAVTAATFLKKFLLIPHLFVLLVFISLLLATVSSIVYLRKKGCLCHPGIRKNWRYISIMYSTTILANLLMFFVILPALANVNPLENNNGNTSNIEKNFNKENGLSELFLEVQIPCSGHAALIMDEIRKNYTVYSITFTLPNTFQITYDPMETSPEKIASLEIFKTYPATIH